MSQHLSLLAYGRAVGGKARVCRTVSREIRPCGIVGGPGETWVMGEAKRARKAETPKQPSLRLRSGALQLYPDRWEGVVA